jgi:ribosomal protein L7/L12
MSICYKRSWSLTMSKEPKVESAWETEAKHELGMGNKANAVKIVRDHLHVGLQEARELVEAWERARGKKG